MVIVWDRAIKNRSERDIFGRCALSALRYLRSQEESIRKQFVGSNGFALFTGVVEPIILNVIDGSKWDESVQINNDKDTHSFLAKHGVDWPYLFSALQALHSVQAVKLTEIRPQEIYLVEASKLITDKDEVEDEAIEPPAVVMTTQEANEDILSDGTVSARKAEGKYSTLLKQEFSLSERFDPFLGNLVGEIHAYHKMRARKDAVEVTKRALQVLLGNLYRAYQRDPKLYVALSLSANDYVQSDLNPLKVSFRGIDRVVEYLTNSAPPLATRRKGNYHHTNPAYSFYSRLRANEKLIENIESFLRTLAPQENTHRITNDTSTGAAFSFSDSSLFARSPLPIIRLKDEEKSLISFPWNDETSRLRDELQSWNEFRRLHWVDLILPNEEFLKVVNNSAVDDDTNDVDEFGEESKGHEKRVDIAFDCELYRVFNNSSFEQGGRFYGGWWQNIKSEYRKFITINWVPTKELDYSNMQAAMLYAREGIQFAGDAYQIDGIPDTYRKLLKRSFFKIINAPGRIRAPFRSELPEGWTWNQILSALKDKHAPIAHHMNSGIGLHLQSLDSKIAMEVMRRFQLEDSLSVD